MKSPAGHCRKLSDMLLLNSHEIESADLSEVVRYALWTTFLGAPFLGPLFEHADLKPTRKRETTLLLGRPSGSGLKAKVRRTHSRATF